MNLSFVKNFNKLLDKTLKQVYNILYSYKNWVAPDKQLAQVHALKRIVETRKRYYTMTKELVFIYRGVKYTKKVSA